MKLNGCFFASSFIPEQGLQLDYKYLLISESQKEARDVVVGRIKTDLVAMLFLWDESNSAFLLLKVNPSQMKYSNTV